MIVPHDGEMEFREIARELGVSTRRVQQLYVQAMKKLRAHPEALAAIQSLAHERDRLRPYESL